MKEKTKLLPVVTTGLTVLAFGALLCFSFESYLLVQAKASAVQHANRVAGQLEQRLTQGLGATYALAALVKQGNGSIQDFHGVSKQLMAISPGISSLQIAPKGVIQSVEPLSGNEIVVGQNLMTDDKRNKEARLAVQTGRLTLAGPFELLQGGEAVVGRLPVFLGGKQDAFWGFTTAVLRMSDLLDASHLADLDLAGYNHEIWRKHPDTDTRHVLAKARQSFSAEPVTVPIDVPNGRWFLSLAPTAGWFSFVRLFAESILVLFFTMASSWAVHLFLRNQQALIKSDADLQIAARAFEAQVGVVVTDANAVILRVNQTFTETTGYSAEELIGQTPRLFKSGRHDADFYTSMWQSLKHDGVWEGEVWDRRKNGEIYPKWLNISAIKEKYGAITHYVGTQNDISDQKAAEAKILNLAFYDPLTKLPNRRLLLDRLHQALATSARTGHKGALLFIDLDDFKTLNDSLGHDAGDQLLQQVAQRLTSLLRESDTVARLGGDEFVVMLNDLSANFSDAATQAQTAGERILTALNQPYSLGSYQHHSTPSIGVALIGTRQDTVEDLLKRADIAMYQAKTAGRNTLRFFDPEMQAAVSARVEMYKDLREALLQKQFLLHYQPQLDKGGRTIGAEALLRWQHQQRGWVPPDTFMPLAEETGTILPLGQWVLETACAQLALWAAKPSLAHLTIAVNVSARQFYQPDFVDQVRKTLKATGANAQRLKIELTESSLVENLEDIIAKMTALKSIGVSFSMDDFGIGYSCLSYLKQMPLDQLKIDQSFVHNIITDQKDAAICRAIVALAQSLGLSIIAEGVETEIQKNFLASIGCDAYQGYFFSRPISIESFEEYAQSNQAA